MPGNGKRELMKNSLEGLNHQLLALKLAVCSEFDAYIRWKTMVSFGMSS